MASPDTKPIHLPGLNGLRAIAATVVLLQHTTMSLYSFDLVTPSTPNVAAFAVTIFFALSGFLITYLLLQEKRQSQTVRLKAFYARRILRIWPLYFLYLLLCFLWTGSDGWTGWSLTCYIFLAPSIPLVFGGAIPHAEHYWSLGVEEQFYAFWPALLKHSEHVRRSVLWFLALFMLAKLIVIGRYGGWSHEYGLMYVTQFDSMAIGALGGWQLCHQPASCTLLVGRLREAAAWLTVIVIALYGTAIPSLVVHPIVAVATVVLIINQVSNPRPLLPLENAPLDYVGRISFGIYVYHPLVIAVHSVWMKDLMLPAPVKYGAVYAAAVLTTVILAELSYRYFELPFLRLKQRYATVPSRDSMRG